MSSNLPPGVTEGMIPGNRPEDTKWDRFLGEEVPEMVKDLSLEEAKMAVILGVAIVPSVRDYLKSLFKEWDVEAHHPDFGWFWQEPFFKKFMEPYEEAMKEKWERDRKK